MKKILAIIVLAQFFCSSTWFAVNAVLKDMSVLSENMIGNFTTATQLGFIVGTLVFAIYGLADRYSPSKLFFVSALLVSLFNLILILPFAKISILVGSRFIVGFFLAGIYPVGMKIAADHFEAGLGKSLGFLVGALVLGTALPHLIRGLSMGLSWQTVVYSTSFLCFVGGVIMVLLVSDGPFRVINPHFKLNSLSENFKSLDFKTAAFGYFGHMWELYTFWAFVPIILHQNFSHSSEAHVSLLSFMVIGSGSVACVLSGFFSKYVKEKKLAFICLFLSMICCLGSPIIFSFLPKPLLLIFLVFWGMAVIADSPLFSTLVAKAAQPNSKGAALTLVNCIGFSLTVVSIQFLGFWANYISTTYLYTLLALGPIWGLFALLKKKEDKFFEIKK